MKPLREVIIVAKSESVAPERSGTRLRGNRERAPERESGEMGTRQLRFHPAAALSSHNDDASIKSA